MRYLAIDYGLKRIGLAICDVSETIVSPLCQLERDRRYPAKLLLQIDTIAGENQVDAVVVGLPINMDGTEGDQARLTRKFCADLAEVITIPLYLQDERLSSSAADEMLSESGLTSNKRRQRRDMLAACDILGDFLRAQKEFENE